MKNKELPVDFCPDEPLSSKVRPPLTKFAWR